MTVKSMTMMAALVPAVAFGFEVKIGNRALNPVMVVSPETAEKVTLVKDGHVAFAIVADTNQERRVHKALTCITPAVTRLQKFVEQATGERPDVFASAKDVPERKAILFVGKSADTVALGIDASTLPPEGFVVKTVKGGVALVGNDSSVVPAFPEQHAKFGKGPRKATVWAVYDFMERAFGMRFFYPGPDGTLVPKLTDVVLPPCKYTDAPRFKRRGAYYMELKAEGVLEATGQTVTTEDLEDFNFADRFAKTDSFSSMHSPFPEEWARANTDKVEVAFFRNEQGHLYYNPKTHAGNYFDITNLKFADALVDSLHRYYDSDGRDRQGFRYNDGSYITFGQCDMELTLAEMQAKPIVKELGLITQENIDAGPTGYFSDIYARFYQHLGNRLLKEFPGKKLVVMPYAGYVLPPFQAKYRPLPPNVEVGVCIGDMPRFFSNPERAAKCRKLLRGWYEALGNRPVQQLWTYLCGDNYLSGAIATQEMGPFVRGMGETLGDIEIFHEMGVAPAKLKYAWCNCCNFYYSTYAGMRAFWNPAFDFEAAIDEHWEGFYGPAAGPHLRNVHKALREAYFVHAAPKADPKPLYPLDVLNVMSDEMDAAEKALKPGSVEMRRFVMFSKLLRENIAEQRAQHAYVVPKADLGKYTGDWTDAKPLKMMNPLGGDDVPAVCPALRLAYDEKGIYGHVTMAEKPLVNAKDMWAGDVVEIFFCPGTEKATKVQFYVDPLNKSGSTRQVLKPIPTTRDGTWRCPGFTSTSKLTETDWTLDFFVPYAGLGEPVPAKGSSWHFSFVFNHQSVPVAATSMNLGDNHNTTYYGEIRFVGQGD